MRKYKNRQMGQLARQLSMGLLRLRLDYINAAEALINQVTAEENYPYDFVMFKLTGYRSGGPEEQEILRGSDLREDLQSLILDLCDSFDYGVAASDQTVYDTESLAEKFNVSTKTIQRWRKSGLVARRMVFPNGKRRIAFLQHSVDHFQAAAGEKVEKSSRFTQLTRAQKQDILRRARRMAGWCKCSLNEVARRIAAKTGRAVETIRYTIRRHDKAHPDEAIFPNLNDPLDDVTRQVIYRSFLRGVSITDLAERHRRTRGSIYRVINEMRARRLLMTEIDYVYSDEFAEDQREQEFAGQMPKPSSPVKLTPAPKDLPAYLASLYKSPLLETPQERHLFRKYNFLKYKADLLRKKLDVAHLSMADVARIEALLAQANATKNRIIRANLRLVVSIARKHLGSAAQNLFELISDGNLSLMRAVEKFDYSRGYKFSTYASWAIMKNYARSVPRERYRQGQFQTGQDEVLDVAAGMAAYEPDENRVPELRESIDAVLAQLSSRERAILVGHYGLTSKKQTATLDELGKQLGISKERVRQIEISALKKLRDMLEDEKPLLLN